MATRLLQDCEFAQALRAPPSQRRPRLHVHEQGRVCDDWTCEHEGKLGADLIAKIRSSDPISLLLRTVETMRVSPGKAAKLAIAQHQRDLVPGVTVDQFGSCIEFRNTLRPIAACPKRGIPSDSFSDSYGDFGGSAGIELLSDSVAC